MNGPDPVVDQLIAALARRGPEGTPRFSREQLDDVIPFLVLSAGLPDSAPSPALLARMDAFFRKAGIDPAAPPERIQAAVDAWFAKHPPDRQIMRVFEEVLGGAEQDASNERAAVVRKAAGTPTDRRPVGSAGAGFKLGGLAQFALQGAMNAITPPKDAPRVDTRTTPPNADKELL